MKPLLPYSKSTMTWMLVIPTLAWCYIGLFLTMSLWYPTGISGYEWQQHLLHFSIVYILWLIVLFSYRLFDWETLRTSQTFLGRLLAALIACLVIAVLYFYFQPALLITPRRFLLVHLFISGAGIMLWYLMMRRAASRTRRRNVYVHNSLTAPEEVRALIENHQLLGLKYGGILPTGAVENFSADSIIVVPARAELDSESSKALFALRSQGARFVEYHEMHEELTRTVHLSVLSDLWFIHSINYGTHQLFDASKRLVDIAFGFLGTIVFLVTFPLIALLIKLSSKGKIIFSQDRVGQNNETFTLYKYRTMASSTVNNTWTAPGDKRITSLGKILRSLRLDELPQSINILKGDMSIVGPRPEQVNIVEQLESQIPYYGERHIVKPGLTGWAQLHVYAGSLEETRQKLQYDLYYIKHRSFLFDIEIILKTFYNVITFSGR